MRIIHYLCALNCIHMEDVNRIKGKSVPANGLLSNLGSIRLLSASGVQTPLSQTLRVC